MQHCHQSPIKSRIFCLPVAGTLLFWFSRFRQLRRDTQTLLLRILLRDLNAVVPELRIAQPTRHAKLELLSQQTGQELRLLQPSWSAYQSFLESISVTRQTTANFGHRLYRYTVPRKAVWPLDARDAIALLDSNSCPGGTLCKRSQTQTRQLEHEATRSSPERSVIAVMSRLMQRPEHLLSERGRHENTSRDSALVRVFQQVVFDDQLRQDIGIKLEQREILDVDWFRAGIPL